MSSPAGFPPDHNLASSHPERKGPRSTRASASLGGGKQGMSLPRPQTLELHTRQLPPEICG